MLKARLPGAATRLLVATAWLLAVLLAAAVTADLLARFTAPHRQAAVSPTVSDPQRAARQIVARAPFAGVTTSTSEPLPAPGRHDYTLVGVATGFGSAPGFALLQGPGGKIESAAIGESIGADTTLVAIHPDRIEIERNGVREALPLTTGSNAPAATPSPSPNPANLR
ncbi:MAG: hypothetical protein KJZ96_09390 [Rhodocyclaceae bacterium]|jgi:type II secretory pathway component PulC|nr:hypothetical protein [Rhodocyclaceae bacterium]